MNTISFIYIYYYIIIKKGIKTSRDIHQWRMKKTSILQKSSILGRRYNQFKDNDSAPLKK